MAGMQVGGHRWGGVRSVCRSADPPSFLPGGLAQHPPPSRTHEPQRGRCPPPPRNHRNTPVAGIRYAVEYRIPIFDIPYIEYQYSVFDIWIADIEHRYRYLIYRSPLRPAAGCVRVPGRGGGVLGLRRGEAGGQRRPLLQGYCCLRATGHRRSALTCAGLVPPGVEGPPPHRLPDPLVYSWRPRPGCPLPGRNCRLRSAVPG